MGLNPSQVAVTDVALCTRLHTSEKGLTKMDIVKRPSKRGVYKRRFTIPFANNVVATTAPPIYWSMRETSNAFVRVGTAKGATSCYMILLRVIASDITNHSDRTTARYVYARHTKDVAPIVASP